MAADRDALKGQLLDAWLEDLRHEREPRRPPPSLDLSGEELEELMRLARWYKAVLFPSAPPVGAVDELAGRLAARVAEERRAEAEAVRQLVSHVPTFAEALRTSSRELGIELRNIEAACTLAKGTLARLLNEELPPHRVPVEKMVVVFRGLRLPGEAVELMRAASVGWAECSVAAAQTRLGRIDAAIDDGERSKLLATDDPQGALARELGRVEEYCAELRVRLGPL